MLGGEHVKVIKLQCLGSTVHPNHAVDMHSPVIVNLHDIFTS